jgi:hypothetical protein
MMKRNSKKGEHMGRRNTDAVGHAQKVIDNTLATTLGALRQYAEKAALNPAASVAADQPKRLLLQMTENGDILGITLGQAASQYFSCRTEAEVIALVRQVLGWQAHERDEKLH